MICECFEPVWTPDARALIVGSMPSVRSLELAQYYGHPRNAFWPMISSLLGEECPADYEERKALIRRHHLALWDAAACCEREGSLDSAMREIRYNDFGKLYGNCPLIRTVLCNGGTAHSLFVKGGNAGDRLILRLPSTSPAYTLSFEKKKEVWAQALRTAGILPTI